MTRLLLALCTAALLAACGQRPPSGVTSPVRLQSKANFYLRTGFDTDPSAYIGRFLPRGTPADAIDDANAVRTECSDFFSVRRVGGGGVRLDEYFAASSQAAAALGISGSPMLGMQHGAARVARVRYTFANKWIADLRDPAGFAECCAKADDNCSDRIIGEFIGGTGDLMQAVQSQTDVDGSIPGAAQLQVRDGYAWRVSQSMPNPVFFAFKVTPVTVTGRSSMRQASQDWDRRIPKVAHGQYFVGVSEWLDSEAIARETALRDAQRQAVRYFGTQVTQGERGGRQSRGRAQAIDLVLNDEARFSRASQGLVRFLKDEDWKIEESPGTGGWRYRAKVLAFIHNNQINAAVAAVEAAAR